MFAFGMQTVSQGVISLIFTGTCLSLVLSFYTINFFLLFLDLFAQPAVLMKYKIQKDKNVPVSSSLYCVI